MENKFGKFYIAEDKLLVLKESKFVIYNPANGQILSSDEIDITLKLRYIVHANDRFIVAFTCANNLKAIQFYVWSWESKSFKLLTTFDGKLNEFGVLEDYQVAFLENDKLALISPRSSNEVPCIIEVWKMSEHGAEKLDVKERTYNVRGVKALPGCKFALVSPKQLEICSDSLEVLCEFELDILYEKRKFSIESISNELLMLYFDFDELIIYNFQNGELVKKMKGLFFQFFVSWDNQFLVGVSSGILTFYDMVHFNVYNQAESRFRVKQFENNGELTFLRGKEYFIFDSQDGYYNEIKIFKF